MKRQSGRPKPKKPLRKENWQAIRRRYTWHLHPPFADSFDREHWWVGQPDVEPIAALYELVRRHPLVGAGLLARIPTSEARANLLADFPGSPPEVIEAWLRVMTQKAIENLNEPPSLHWTCLLGLKSWAKLDYTERKNWEGCVGYLKGLDFRYEELKCRSINILAEWKIQAQREHALREKVGSDEIEAILKADLSANPPTAEEWEAAIGYRAIEAYRQGYLLLAVAPDLQTEKASSLMEKVYRIARRIYARPKQRARWQNWLPIISEFETASVNTGQEAKSPSFIRYRRVMDGIRFG